MANFDPFRTDAPARSSGAGASEAPSRLTLGEPRAIAEALANGPATDVGALSFTVSDEQLDDVRAAVERVRREVQSLDHSLAVDIQRRVGEQVWTLSLVSPSAADPKLVGDLVDRAERALRAGRSLTWRKPVGQVDQDFSGLLRRVEGELMGRKLGAPVTVVERDGDDVVFTLRLERQGAAPIAFGALTSGLLDLYRQCGRT